MVTRAAARLRSTGVLPDSAPRTKTRSARASGAWVWQYGPSAWLARRITSKSIVSAWTPGIPILKMRVEYGDNEHKLFDDGREQAAAMLEAAGAKNIVLPDRIRCPASVFTRWGVRAWEMIRKPASPTGIARHTTSPTFS